MFHTLTRSTILSTLVALVLALVALPAFAQTTVMRVVSTSPNPFNPTKGEYTRITFSVTQRAEYRIYIRNSAGTTIQQVASYSSLAAGTYSANWNGRDRSNAIVPDGTYTVVMRGTTNKGADIPAATGTVQVVSVVPVVKLTAVTPSTIDAKAGQKATIAFTTPTSGTYTVNIRTSAGTNVRLVSTHNVGAGNFTTVWDGRNSTNAIVADGVYTVVLAGTTGTGIAVAPVTMPVTVKTAIIDGGGTTTPPPTGGELGQMIEGCGAGNFQSMQNPGVKFGIAFRAVKSGSFSRIMMTWNRYHPGYGAGNDGTYTFELQTNASSGLQPSGTVISRVTGIKPAQSVVYPGGAMPVPLTGTVTAGQIYHIVVNNTDPDPRSNWSSPNTLMTRVLPWDPATFGGPDNNFRCESTITGSWKPWTFSSSNVFNTTGSSTANGQHIAVVMFWNDGTRTGDPYYGAWNSGMAQVYGSRKYGQFITWDKPSATITRIGMPFGRRGTPSGALIYHLEEVGRGDIATGTLATGSQVGTVPTWAYVNLPSAITLTQGKTYRLYVASPSSSSGGYYIQYPPYGDGSPTEFISTSWGAGNSYYIYNTSGSWASNRNADLSFSLK